MAENPRVAWTIAYDVGSRRLQNDDFAQLGVKECKASFADDTRVLVQLRLEKRMRSNPVVEELRRLLNSGRIQRAWIQRRPTTDDAKIDTMAQLDAEPIELERIDVAEHDDTAAAKSKPKKKQLKAAARSASTTPLMVNEPRAQRAKSMEEDDEEEEQDEEENDEDADARIKTLIASCMKDLQKDLQKDFQRHLQKRMKQLEDKLQGHKRTKNHHAPNPKPKPAAKPIVKPEGLPYNRPPVKLSFLRTASVSELYYSGVWVPGWNLAFDPTFEPKRSPLFLSELPEEEYIEGYDIDDKTYESTKHPDTTLYKDKAEARGRKHWKHFVDSYPVTLFKPVPFSPKSEALPETVIYGGPASLWALRESSIDVLVLLNVFFLGYDIDDMTQLPDPIPDRPRKTKTELCKEQNMLTIRKNELGGLIYHGLRFVKNYDIDDVMASPKAEDIRGFVRDTWQEMQKKFIQ
jgi:hypothetical protein